MAVDYDEALKKAQVAADAVTIKMSDKTVKLPPEPKAREKVIEEPKKNQLVAIPHKVDYAYGSKTREEDLEIDDPVHILLEKFRSGEIAQDELSVDERFVLIRHMREVEGRQQDDIAEELGVTRRTVVNYCKKIKEMKAQALADVSIWELGGELYSQGLKAMEDAMRHGKYKDFAYVMTSLVATLQSLGLVFKLPKQSQIQSEIMHKMSEKQGLQGFQQIKNITDSEEINLDSIFTEMMAAVKTGKLDKKDVDS